MRYLAVVSAALSGATVAVAGAATVHADVGVPGEGMTCLASVQGAMTVLPSGRDFLMCQGRGADYGWVAVAVPLVPSDRWLSYGSEITLHGEGFSDLFSANQLSPANRLSPTNPDLASGQWAAVPLNPAAQCGASQVVTRDMGTLAPALISQGQPGQPLSLRILPKAVTIALSGDCLWTMASP